MSHTGNAWVTLATNDSYSLGALVLAHSLKRSNTAHKLAVLITPAVSQPMREQLQTVFDVVKTVDVLDSKDEAHLALMKRPELGITFTKIHCWRLTEFEKCVFLDADTLVVRNCDELFEREEFSAAPDVSWPDCFNSGVFVYKPSVETFNQLLQFAVEKGSFDGGDQGLLNQFFSDWATKDIKKHLPFVYNLTSVAAYSYIPAFKQYGAETRIVHFIGTGKPWLQQLDPSTRTVTPTSGSEHLAPLLQQWWDLFCEKVHPNLSKNLENNNDGMSHPPVEVRSNTPVTLISDEPQSPGLIEPCVQYREKDDYRQFNLPYQPFDVRGSSGELLNVEFLLASVVPTEESTSESENQVEEKDTKPEVQEEVEETKQTQPEFDDKQEKEEEPLAPKDPFDYDTFFPDEKCVNNYLEQNVVTYQPYETRHEEPQPENIPLPRFLTMPEDDQRQKGNIEVVENQSAPEPPPPPLPAPPAPVLPPDPPKQEKIRKEPTPPPVEKHELLKSKSMTFIPSDINATDGSSPPQRSIWKSQPNVNVDPNRKYSMPKLRPILPRQNSKIIQTPVSRVTLYTEILMSADYKDPVDLPNDKVGFVETELRRSKSEADLKGKFGPLPYAKSPEVEIPQPKKTPFRELENDAYDLSRCKRQLGNKPRDHKKENFTSKLITPTKERKSNVIKKRKSKELSPNDGGKEKPSKKERKEKSRYKRNENVDEILKRLWEFSKNYQHYFGIDGQSGTKERPIQSEFKQFRNFVKGQKETTQKGLLGIEDIINENGAKVRSTCVKDREVNGLENDVILQTSDNESRCTRVEVTETISQTDVQCEKKSEEPTNNDKQSVDSETYVENIPNVQTPSEVETTGHQTNFGKTTEKSRGVTVRENTRTDSKTRSIKNPIRERIVGNGDSTQEKPTNGCMSPPKDCPSETNVLEENRKAEKAVKDVTKSPEVIIVTEESETVHDSLDTLPSQETRIVNIETEKVEALKETEETPRDETVQTNSESPYDDSSDEIGELTSVVSPSRIDMRERRVIVNGETDRIKAFKEPEETSRDETIQTNRESIKNGCSSEKTEQIKSVVFQPRTDIQESTMIATDKIAFKEPDETIQANGDGLQNGCSSEKIEPQTDFQERTTICTRNEESTNQVNNPEVVNNVQMKTKPSETSLQENGSQHSELEASQDVNTNSEHEETDEQDVSNDTTSVVIELTPKGMFTIGSPEKNTQTKGKDSSRPNGNIVSCLQPAQVSKLLKGKGKIRKPDEILCVPDFDTPRSSRILALTPNTDTDAIPQAPPSSPVTTPRKARIQRKPYENGTKYRSPVGKKTPKDSAGIAGAIAQLNLESGGQSAGSEDTNAAHQEYIRRQNWETGNMDYMGKDSFDNIWSKICQTLEGKELDNATEGTLTTKSTEEKTKSGEAAGTEAPVSLTRILEKCPDFIDTLPSESVTGPVEEDEIIFSKPENRQKCLTNIREEEEGGAAEGKSLKLSDILKPEEKKPTGDGGAEETPVVAPEVVKTEEKQEVSCPASTQLQTTADTGEEVNETKPSSAEPVTTQSESKPIQPEIAIQPPTPECTTVAIRQPVYIPGAPTDDQIPKTPAQKIAEKKLQEKPEAPTEPIPLPAPESPNECRTVAIAYPPAAPSQVDEKPNKETPEETATKKVTKEEKQKKGVFSKILEMVGVAPKAEEGSKSVFYDVEGKPSKVEEGLEVTEQKTEAGEIPQVTDNEKTIPAEAISKSKEVSEVKEPEKPLDKVQEESAGKKDGDKVPEKPVKDEKGKTEPKPGQAPMPKPARNASPGSSMSKKSPSPIAIPPTGPETAVTETTPPEPPKRRNSALLKIDETLPDTPEPKKEPIKSEVENIIEKAKTEVENILQTAEKESSDLINTMKLMIGAEAAPKAEEVEELKVTSEEDRQRHKGEVVTSKLSDQILKAIPPPRRKAISESKEASGSSGAIPKTPSPGEKPKPKPSSIPVPPPRNKGKPSTPAPPKGKTKK